MGRARLEGVDFRAIGNGPGWQLEIRGGESIVLVADYGQTRVSRPLPVPAIDSENRATHWQSGELVVEVHG